MLAGTELLASIHQWDVNAFHRILHAHKFKAIVNTAYWVSKSADGWPYPIFAAAIFWLGHDLNLMFISSLALAFGLERTVYLLAKKGFKRRRPANILPNFRSLVIASDEFSFPSGHTSGAFLFVTTLVLVFDPLFALLYGWSAAVGCSRVILGVHFPTDILMGALLGSAAATFSISYIAT